ncbi:hypothetical protein F7734_22345 [Scytonema sp. UIC 10036]|uniref:hypothetical protein n=1 Tax=Scytonema sp. UIC 10036 TaxID=2304196 RepID=UPI0012DAEDEA|nr:hypothetical protein [Scytonema sp. UIC 10036]MUG94954.1 hypothetical protein [Scytonema sp. UIC 10036]
MSYQLMLELAIRHPEVYGLAWMQSKSAKYQINRELSKIIEFAVIAFAGSVNPEAADWVVPVLKLCFMILDLLQ